MPKIIRVVNWHLYQHYKDRNPPWIKLYTRLIDGDSREFNRIKDEEKWQFLAILMLASRQQNAIPFDPEWISERLRLRSRLNLKALEATGMIEVVEVASSTLASSKHDAIPETETETETDINSSSKVSTGDPEDDGFQAWFKAYPRRVGKIPAAKAWGKLPPEDRAAAKSAVAAFAASWAARPASEIQFCPHPATWLNQRRWEDERSTQAQPQPVVPEDPAKAAEREFWAKKLAETKANEAEERRRLLEELSHRKGATSAQA